MKIKIIKEERDKHDNDLKIVSTLKTSDGRLCNQKSSFCREDAVYLVQLRKEFKEFYVKAWYDQEYCVGCMVAYLNSDYECNCGFSFKTWESLRGHQISTKHKKYILK